MCQVSGSAQSFASGQVAALCWCHFEAVELEVYMKALMELGSYK
jgi:hypothetical protein